jgi:mannitol-specific phosphotransferase system IIBC component
LALVRVAESSVTAIVYWQLGLFVSEAQALLPVLIASMLIGIPLGAYAIRRLDAETFRRICMSFDAWVVGFGLSRVLIELGLVPGPEAYGFMAATIAIDVWLLYLFFSARQAARRRPIASP